MNWRKLRENLVSVWYALIGIILFSTFWMSVFDWLGGGNYCTLAPAAVVMIIFLIGWIKALVREQERLKERLINCLTEPPNGGGHP
jgi:hypothetical protein